MNKSACLILGSCLALQAPIAINELVIESMDQASIDASMPLPLFQQEHGRELVDGGVQGEKSQPIDTARYIYQRTRELLPVPFRGRSQKIARALIETANEHQMDPLFLMAVINQESQFNPEARGSHGEIGLMQLKPTTAMNRGFNARAHGRTSEDRDFGGARRPGSEHPSWRRLPRSPSRFVQAQVVTLHLGLQHGARPAFAQMWPRESSRASTARRFWLTTLSSREEFHKLSRAYRIKFTFSAGL